MSEKLHDAFISYSRKDRAFASLLEKALEAFSPPKIGTIPQKHLDIFRDEEDFTGTDYHKAVSKHLQDSGKLIVICTPAARASQYVNDEIRVFAETNGSEHIIPILLDGLPNNAATEQQEANKAFPETLVKYMQMPLAIDYRDFRLGSDKVNKGKLASVWFSLLANLYGISRNEIEQREKKRQARIRNLWIGGLGLVIVILSVSLWFTSQARDAEQQAKKAAIEQRDKARRAAAVGEFREAQRLEENEVLPRALAHLAKAVRLDPLWLSSRTVLINLLQQKNWYVPELILKYASSVTSAAFSADGMRVITSSDNMVQLWDVHTGKVLNDAMLHPARVNSVAFSADGTRVVTASSDNTARIWDAKSGQELGEMMRYEMEDEYEVEESEGKVYLAAFSADGTRVVTASSDYTARIWDVQARNVLGDAMRHQDEVRSAVFSADGTRVVTASWDSTARIWDAHSGQALIEPMRHKGPVRSAAFSADGTRVVTASSDYTARIWDAKSGKALGEVMLHEGEVWSAAFSADGARVVTASSDNTARVWDAKSGQALGEAMRHKGAVFSAAFSTDGMRVVTVASDNAARIWDAKSEKALGDAMRHQDKVHSARFSADGTRVVTASWDNTARIWDTKSGKELGEAMRHKGKVFSAAFSTDGMRVVTASEDNTARIWDAKSGQALGEAMWHTGAVSSAAFSVDGTRVVTASWDNTARVWDVLPVVSDPNGLLAELTEAVIGLKLGEYGAIEILDDQIDRLNQLRQRTANAPLGETTAESFVRWFLSGPWTRTISSLSTKSVPEYIQQEIAAGRREQVAQEFPGHPLLRQEKQVEDPIHQIDLQLKPAMPIPAVKPSISAVN